MWFYGGAGTTAPETTAPETTAPESTAPDASAPDTATPAGGTAPDTSAPKPDPTAVPAPASASASEAKVHPGKVTVMVPALGNERFDRAYSTGADKNHSRLVHGFFIATNEKTELVPGIASDWGISADGLTWSFTIRKGVKYHDGTELTPEDALWTWRHYFDPEAIEHVTSGGMQTLAKIMDTIELSEPDQLSMTTQIPQAGWDSYISLAGPTWYPVMPNREKLWDEKQEAAYEQNPIGAGVMKLVRHVPADRMEFERFDDFYFQPENGFYEDRRVKFASLDLVLVPEEATRVAAMRAGEADIVNASLGAKDQVESGGGRLLFGQEGGYIDPRLYGCWPNSEFACRDKRVRQALAYAIDKDLMRDKLFGGPEVMQVKGWAPVTPSTIGYSPELDPFPYDPEKARQLLADAGYPDGKGFGKVTVDTWVSTSMPYLPESAQLAADFWRKELGLDVEVRVGDEGAIKKSVTAGVLHENGVILWRENETEIDAINLMRINYGTPTAKKRHHNDPELFDLVQEAMAVVDPEKRIKVLNDLYLRLRDEQYELGIGYVNIPWAVGPRILTWEPYPLAFWLSAYHTITLE